MEKNSNYNSEEKRCKFKTETTLFPLAPTSQHRTYSAVSGSSPHRLPVQAGTLDLSPSAPKSTLPHDTGQVAQSKYEKSFFPFPVYRLDF